MSDDERPRTGTEGVSVPVRIAAAWSWRLLVIGLLVYVLLRLFGQLELVGFSFVLALFLTAVLHPLERKLRHIRGPRSVSAALALLIGLAMLGAIGYFVTWQISSHASELGDQITNFVTSTRRWLERGPLHLKSSDLDRATANITAAIKSHQGQLISGAIQTVRTVVDVLSSVLLVLLSTFFLLRDGEQIWAWVIGLFPKPAHQRLDVAGRAGWHTFGGYMRGQLLIALFHGVSVTVILIVLRVPLAAALGVTIFLGSFIPLVGVTVAGILCIAVTGLEHGLTAAIVVTIAIIVLVQLEAHLLQPMIMSRSVQVHPLAIALSVVAGTTLFGIVGALVAVPLVAFLNSTVHAIRATPAVPSGDAGFPVAHTDSAGNAVDSVQAAAREAAESGLSEVRNAADLSKGSESPHS